MTQTNTNIYSGLVCVSSYICCVAFGQRQVEGLLSDEWQHVSSREPIFSPQTTHTHCTFLGLRGQILLKTMAVNTILKLRFSYG